MEKRIKQEVLKYIKNSLLITSELANKKSQMEKDIQGLALEMIEKMEVENKIR